MTGEPALPAEDGVVAALRAAADSLSVAAADRIDALNARIAVLERELGSPGDEGSHAYAQAMLARADRFYFGKNRMGANVWVETRGHGRWCVSNGSACYSTEGYWEPEGMSSGRTEEFFARTRFTLAEAVVMAGKALVAPFPDF